MTKKIINFVLSITLILLPIMKIPICFGISSSFYGAKIILLYGSASILLILLLINYKDLSFDKVDLLLLSFLILVCISTFFSLNLRVSILGSYDRFDGMLTFIAYYIIYYSAKYFSTKFSSASISFLPISSLTECIERSGIPISTVLIGKSVDAIEPNVPPPLMSDLFTKR